MKPICSSVVIFFFLALPAKGQQPDSKMGRSTVEVQAIGTYEADPDLATLSFNVSAQEKDLNKAYSKATDSINQIVALATRNGLSKQDMQVSVFRVTPNLSGNRNVKANSYRVEGEISLKIRDFSKIGVIFDGSVEEGIGDFRSLTYSLADEEQAKEHAIAEAMQNAASRANVAVRERGQKLGVLRHATIDVQRVATAAPADLYGLFETSTERRAVWHANEALQQPLSNVSQGKIAVTATVQCSFEIL